MKNTLVILPNNLGDVIMSLPVLEGLKRQCDEHRVVFLVEEGFEGGLVNNPNCDRIVCFDRKRIHDSLRSPDWKKSLSALSEFVEDLGKERFGRVVNLSQHPYIAFIVSLLSCPDTAGRRYLRSGNHALRDAWSRYLYAIPFARRYNSLHATDIYRHIAGVAHIPAGRPMSVGIEERQRAGAFFAARDFRHEGRPLMIFQPGAAYAAKRWPLEHFIGLGKRLAAEGYGIIVTGAPAEREIADGLAAGIGASCIVTAGELTFRETIALLPFARGCVTGDTAIMHAAAALGVKVYALFGPTNPVETGPWGEGHFVFSGRCAKRPCFCFDCQSRLCMKSILPEDVYDAIKGAKSAKAHCDVYMTARDADGTLGLDSVIEEGVPYFDPLGAAVTRRVPEPAYAPALRFDSGAAGPIREETARFCAALDGMAAALSAFLTSGDKGSIGRFESLRAEAANLSGIGPFWMALLNLRLNGVPLLDPVAAVGESAEVCALTKSEIEAAVSVLR